MADAAGTLSRRIPYLISNIIKIIPTRPNKNII